MSIQLSTQHQNASKGSVVGKSQMATASLSRIALQMLQEEAAKKSQPQIIQKIPEKYLVLDLDQTLVFGCGYVPSHPATRIEVYLPDDFNIYYVSARPGLIEFLESMKPLYNIIVYTTAQLEYAEMVIETLKLKSFVTKLYARGDCWRVKHNTFIKEIKRLKVPLQSTVFIDDCEVQIGHNEPNGLHIKPYIGQSDDTELKTIIPFLQKLAEEDDVRSVAQKAKEFFNPQPVKSRFANTSNRPSCRSSTTRPDFVKKMKHIRPSQISQKDLCEDSFAEDKDESPHILVNSFMSRKISEQSTANDLSLSPFNRSMTNSKNLFIGGGERFLRFNKPQCPEINVSGDLLTLEDEEGISALPITVSYTKQTRFPESFWTRTLTTKKTTMNTHYQ